MILSINNIEYKMNSKYKISEFKKLLAYDITLESYWPNVIATAFNAPIEKISLLEYEHKKIAISFISLYLNNIKADYINTNLIDLDNISLANYIDLEVYFNSGLHSNLDKIIKILFNVDEDDYINEYWGGVLFFINWRNQVIKSYKNLFNNDDEDETEANKSNNYVASSWFKTVAFLADDDILKMNQILELNFKLVFNFLSYKKEKIHNELRASNRTHTRYNQ